MQDKEGEFKHFLTEWGIITGSRISNNRNKTEKKIDDLNGKTENSKEKVIDGYSTHTQIMIGLNENVSYNHVACLHYLHFE